MKHSIVAGFVVLFAGLAPALAADAPPAAAPAATPPQTQPAYPAGFDTVNKRASYFFGLNLGANVKSAPIEIDTDMLVLGIRDAVAGGKHKLTDEQIKETVQELQREMAARQASAKADGEAFLAKNKTAQGVVTTASGLQYRVVKEGAGKTPTAADTVTVNYTGTLINGKVFDTSEGRGPATFPVGGVIRGWTEALQLMKEGAKYQLFIPAALAYGEEGTPNGAIPPNSTLVFDVELISISAK